MLWSNLLSEQSAESTAKFHEDNIMLRNYAFIIRRYIDYINSNCCIPVVIHLQHSQNHSGLIIVS